MTHRLKEYTNEAGEKLIPPIIPIKFDEDRYIP